MKVSKTLNENSRINAWYQLAADKYSLNKTDSVKAQRAKNGKIIQQIIVRFLPSVKWYALCNKSITYVIESITEVYYVSQDFKMVLLKNFFIFHPILMKLGEILVLMSSKISPSFIEIGW